MALPLFYFLFAHLGARHYTNLFLKTKLYLSFSFMTKVVRCLSELNPLYLPEMGFVFSILETRNWGTQELRSKGIWCILETLYVFSALNSLCKLLSFHYIQQGHLWLRATPQEKAGKSTILKISELLLGQSDSSNSSLELRFQQPCSEHFFTRPWLTAGSVSEEAKAIQINVFHSAPLLSISRWRSVESGGVI